MGIKSAPEVYQQRMEQVFEGLPGVKFIVDDIIIHGRTGPEHDTRLRAVLQRAKDNNLRCEEVKVPYTTGRGEDPWPLVLP